MKNIANHADGISLHYYTVKGWDGSKGSATEFTNEEYYNTLGKAVEIESVIKRHIAIMDSYDPENKVDLLLDEWGTWFDALKNSSSVIKLPSDLPIFCPLMVIILLCIQ